jgi:hypothetical protein
VLSFLKDVAPGVQLGEGTAHSTPSLALGRRSSSVVADASATVGRAGDEALHVTLTADTPTGQGDDIRYALADGDKRSRLQPRDMAAAEWLHGGATGATGQRSQLGHSPMLLRGKQRNALAEAADDADGARAGAPSRRRGTGRNACVAIGEAPATLPALLDGARGRGACAGPAA